MHHPRTIQKRFLARYALFHSCHSLQLKHTILHCLLTHPCTGTDGDQICKYRRDNDVMKIYGTIEKNVKINKYEQYGKDIYCTCTRRHTFKSLHLINFERFPQLVELQCKRARLYQKRQKIKKQLPLYVAY